MGPNESKWVSMGPNGSKLIQIGPNWSNKDKSKKINKDTNKDQVAMALTSGAVKLQPPINDKIRNLWG